MHREQKDPVHYRYNHKYEYHQVLDPRIINNIKTTLYFVLESINLVTFALILKTEMFVL